MKKLRTKKQSVFFAILLVSFALLMYINSCQENPITSPSAALYLKTDTTSTSDAANITLDSAKIIVEDIKFHRASPKDSSNIKLGPFRVYINLNFGNLTEWGVNGVPPGSYDKVSFYIHKHNPNDPLPNNDSDFVNDSGTVGYSAVIAGTYNGESFVYRSPKSAHQKVTIDPPLVIPEATDGVFNATLVVNPKLWFLKNGQYIDPRDPANANDIDNNIKDSFNKAFKDQNKDGIPD
ncbi:MAG: hypothetical protein ACRDFC_00260 [Ignavibacteria bacterium]